MRNMNYEMKQHELCRLNEIIFPRPTSKTGFRVKNGQNDAKPSKIIVEDYIFI